MSCLNRIRKYEHRHCRCGGIRKDILPYVSEALANSSNDVVKGFFDDSPSMLSSIRENGD